MYESQFKIFHRENLRTASEPLGRRHLLAGGGCVLSTERLLSRAASPVDGLSCVFSMTCCGSCVSTCHFLCPCALGGGFSPEPSRADPARFRVYFCSLLTPLSLHRIEEIRVLLWMRLWLKGVLGWSDPLSRPPELSPHQQESCLSFSSFV